jgi:hypothetical protein
VKLTIIAVMTLVFAASASAQKLAVKIVDRQDNETDYTYVVPAHFFANSNTNVNCNGGDTYANCNASTTTTGTSTLAHQVSYHVRGATFSFQLPGCRIAVVNCESKFAERFAGRVGNHRSCRMPIVDSIQTDFYGDKAKLEWVVSLDEKKCNQKPTKYWVFWTHLKTQPIPPNNSEFAPIHSSKKAASSIARSTKNLFAI